MVNYFSIAHQQYYRPGNPAVPNMIFNQLVNPGQARGGKSGIFRFGGRRKYSR
jgi:hypothetical protein